MAHINVSVDVHDFYFVINVPLNEEMSIQEINEKLSKAAARMLTALSAQDTFMETER